MFREYATLPYEADDTKLPSLPHQARLKECLMNSMIREAVEKQEKLEMEKAALRLSRKKSRLSMKKTMLARPLAAAGSMSKLHSILSAQHMAKKLRRPSVLPKIVEEKPKVWYQIRTFEKKWCSEEGNPTALSSHAFEDKARI